jgi:hypothetical protein
MAWEWVGPTAASVVGLAGLTATALTAYTQQRNQLKILQLQRSHVESDALRAEKRNVYLKASGAIAETLRMTNTIHSVPPETRAHAILDAQRNLEMILDEVEIAAPRWVDEYAKTLFIHTSARMKEKISGKDAGRTAYKALSLARNEFMIAAKYDIRGDTEEDARTELAAVRKVFTDSGLEYETMTERLMTVERSRHHSAPPNDSGKPDGPA